MSRRKYIVFLRQGDQNLFLWADRTGLSGDTERSKSEKRKCGGSRLLCDCRTPHASPLLP